MDFLFAVKLKVPVEDKSSRFIKCGRRESTRVWLGGQEAVRINILTATAASSLFGCLVMGIAANLPFALAPSMGINAYFTYTVVGYLGSGPVSFLQAPLKKKKRREKKGGACAWSNIYCPLFFHVHSGHFALLAMAWQAVADEAVKVNLTTMLGGF